MFSRRGDNLRESDARNDRLAQCLAEVERALAAADQAAQTSELVVYDVEIALASRISAGVVRSELVTSAGLGQRDRLLLSAEDSARLDADVERAWHIHSRARMIACER